MFPTLFSIGTFEFQTIWLIAAISALIFSLIAYLRSEGEVLPVDKVFDVLILTVIGGFIFGKLVAAFLAFGELDFGQALKVTGVNFWGGVFGSLAILSAISQKFKLSPILMADIAALSAIPAAAFFSLEKLVTASFAPVNIFTLVWYIAGSLIFLKSSQRVQFPSFYLTISAIFFAVGQIVLELSQAAGGSVRIFNLTISASILTFSGILYYLRSGRKIGKDLVWLGQNLNKTLKRLKSILPSRGKPWKSNYYG